MYGIEEGKCSSPSFSPFSSALPPLSGAKEGGEGRAVMSPIEKRVEGGRKRHLVKEGGKKEKERGGLKQLPPPFPIPSHPGRVQMDLTANSAEQKRREPPPSTMHRER